MGHSGIALFADESSVLGGLCVFLVNKIKLVAYDSPTYDMVFFLKKKYNFVIIGNNYYFKK